MSQRTNEADIEAMAETVHTHYDKPRYGTALRVHKRGSGMARWSARSAGCL